MMNRWARVTDFSDDDVVFWINENNVKCLQWYKDGCMIVFSTNDDDTAHVKEDLDEIFAGWDDWYSIHKDVR
jgi:hypothetical protein